MTADSGSQNEVSLADLAVQAIDFVSLAAVAEAGAADEFDRRISWHLSGPTGPKSPF